VENTEYRKENLAALRGRLFRLLWSALALENSTIKILERTTLHCVPPEAIDIADLTDRLHEAFNAFTFLQRLPIWHEHEDLEDEQDDLPDHLQRR